MSDEMICRACVERPRCHIENDAITQCVYYAPASPSVGERPPVPFAEWERVATLADEHRVARRQAESRLAEITRAVEGLAGAVRVALGTMQKPMERMERVCAAGLVEPACDHNNVRALQEAMRTLDDAHAAALRSLLSSSGDGGTP